MCSVGESSGPSSNYWPIQFLVIKKELISNGFLFGKLILELDFLVKDFGVGYSIERESF